MVSFSCYLFFCVCVVFVFFNDTATTEIDTLSLHDALPISQIVLLLNPLLSMFDPCFWCGRYRSEEHTSELQSPCNLVCHLLLEKKNTTATPSFNSILGLPTHATSRACPPT